ncbi:BLUF domain-containing protein [Jannaschia rubra]|uniref:Blue light-and temperature-regulated antirepressor YcgF n=1 Tax=Jannaschia rubra TaxID=282197 RepID=A0A0M6XU72_9RHOB|nr:BLUF domain-containing protein [Jannaschia rubra]CTQ34282.1 Blue light-and temperature-regulated antirepressor YcgF [Jannaschia rubra]SFG18867.1 Sensors of blue-light using FAD [Jannaschia rubra]
MNLTRLVYYSQHNPSMSLGVPDLIATCHRNNAALDVTGFLQFNGHSFLQVLEGGRAEVSSLYNRIVTDPRHLNVILIQCCDVRERMFPGWSMGLHEGMDEQTKKVFLRYFSGNTVNPETIGADSLLAALRDLSREMA